MKIEFVFIDKKEQNDKSLHLKGKQLKSALTKCFSNITDTTFDIEIGKKLYTADFSIVRCKATETENNDMVYNVSISFIHKTRKREAQVLEQALNRIENCNDIKKSFLSIIAYDGVSSFYCNKAYPKSNEFERQLRHLIFKMLTKCLGTLWFDKTIDDKLKDELKKNININNKKVRDEKLIESALYEMSAYQLEEYLFREKRDAEFDVFSFSNDSLNSFTKDKLLEIIDKSRAKTLWERYFDKDLQINDLQAKLVKIRSFRNNIAHSKQFYSKDYNDYSAIIDELSEKIVVGIDKTAIIELKSALAQKALVGFSSILTGIASAAINAGYMLTPVVSKLSDFGSAIYDMYQNSLSHQLSEMLEAGRRAIDIKPIFPDYLELIRNSEQFNFHSYLRCSNPFADALRQNQEFSKSLVTKWDISTFFHGSTIDMWEKKQRALETLFPKLSAYDTTLKYSALFCNPVIEAWEKQQKTFRAMLPKYPMLSAIQIQNSNPFTTNTTIDSELDDVNEPQKGNVEIPIKDENSIKVIKSKEDISND